MKKVLLAVVLSAALGVVPVLAQEKGNAPMKGQMPMKEGTPMKNESMQSGGMMMGKMKEMQGKMAEMRKGMDRHDEGTCDDENR